MNLYKILDRIIGLESNKNKSSEILSSLNKKTKENLGKEKCELDQCYPVTFDKKWTKLNNHKLHNFHNVFFKVILKLLFLTPRITDVSKKKKPHDTYAVFQMEEISFNGSPDPHAFFWFLSVQPHWWPIPKQT